MDTWEMIGAERAAFAGALADLPAESWDRPSLCPGWTVRDVVAHMTATAFMTPPRFILLMARAGFRFNTMTANAVRGLTRERSDAELVELFRSRVGARTAPPGPTVAMLGESIVHGEDVFRALGLYREHPIEHVLAAADFYKGSDLLIGSKRRIAGVTLRATDADWTSGSGPEVAGPALALVMAMTGRVPPLDDLTGDGIEALRAGR
jgi:uncharacterized protein (TIGR03083 family)